MADCELITSARALYNLNNASLTTNEETTLQELIKAVSVAIEKYTGRTFCSTQHDELYNGNNQTRLILKQVPVISVDRVAYNPTTVITAKNTKSSHVRAQIELRGGSLFLRHSEGGNNFSVNLSIPASLNSNTISALKTEIDTQSGWSAKIPNSKYNDWLASELREVQGVLNAKDVDAPLKMHVQELTEYEVDLEKGWLTRSPGILETVAPWISNPVWFGGINYWRIVYTAGYATIPEDVQEAAAQWVASLFWTTKRDPGLSQEHIPGAYLKSPVFGMTETVKRILEPYRLRRFTKLGG